MGDRCFYYCVNFIDFKFLLLDKFYLELNKNDFKVFLINLFSGFILKGLFKNLYNNNNKVIYIWKKENSK